MTILSLNFVMAGEGLQMMTEPVTLDEGRRLVAAAMSDARAMPRFGRDMEDGEVRVFLLGDDSDSVVLEGPACFLPQDAVSALEQYFDVPAQLTERCIAMAVTLAEMKREGKSHETIDAMIEHINADAERNRWAN